MGIREDYQALMEKQLNEWKAQPKPSNPAPKSSNPAPRLNMRKCWRRYAPARRRQWENFGKVKGSNEAAWAEFKAHMDKAGAGGAGRTKA